MKIQIPCVLHSNTQYACSTITNREIQNYFSEDIDLQPNFFFFILK